MPLPAEIESLEAVPEPVRPFYKETESGSFLLDAQGIEDVSGLKSALEKERAARKELKAELERETETNAAPDKRLEAALISAEARAAIHAGNGLAELLLPIVLPRLMLLESSEGITVVVRGEDGLPEHSDDGSVKTAADLIPELQSSPVFGRAFEQPVRVGSGASSLGPAEAHEDVIALSDQSALGRNVAAIARGRVRVAQ